MPVHVRMPLCGKPVFMFVLVMPVVMLVIMGVFHDFVRMQMTVR